MFVGALQVGMLFRGIRGHEKVPRYTVGRETHEGYNMAQLKVQKQSLNNRRAQQQKQKIYRTAARASS